MAVILWFPYHPLYAVIISVLSIQITEGALPCQAGYYQSGTSCVSCPVGSFCTADTKQECPAGTYNGLSKQTSGDSCYECPRGKYSSTGSASCTSCPAGKYCPSAGTAIPKDCPEGWYALSGASACRYCPAGYSCTVATSPVKCNLGEYSPMESMICTRCKAGTSCPSGASQETLCTRGYYSVGTQGSCTKCPSAFYCPDYGTEKPIPCPENTYSTGTASTCILCPLGFSCTPSSSPLVCPYGLYSPLGSMACIKCRLGYYCPYQAGAELECPRGTYSLDGQKACTDCPAGHFCPEQAANSSIPCPENTYSTGKASFCTTCPEGYSCRPSMTAAICTRGEYSPFGSMDCTRCRPGYYCSYKAGAERECPRGTYSLAGQETCTNCPAGHYCPDTALDYTTPCPQNTYSAAKASSCTTCPEGYSCRQSVGATICTRGEYSPVGSMDCTRCRPGYYCSYKAGAERECPRGTYSLAGQETCTNCPAGHYCPHTALNYTTPCPQNTYSIATASSCSTCPEGYYCRPSMSAAICSRGEYSPFGSMDCTRCRPGYSCSYKAGAERECPRGMYSLAGQETCTNCPAGHYCPDTALDYTTPCPQNTYSAAKASSCTTCPEGYSCRQSLGATICTRGEYSPFGSMDCTRCRPGYYCSYKAGAERECPRGTYSLAGHETCTNCPAGHYCPDTALNYTTPCPQNTYSATKASSCITCPEGHSCRPSMSAAYCTRGEYSPFGSMDCTRCRPGYYCSYKAGAERECPRGMYSLAGQETCTNCPAGHYCPDTALNYTTPCPQNTYSLTKAASCIVCPEGYSCTPSSSPATCKSGEYSALGNMKCTRCNPGYYCVSKAGAPKMCPRGYYSMGGALACANCPAGTYCSSDATSTIPCPEGTYSTDKAITCSACPPGHWCTPSTPPVACGNGEYSRLGSMTCSQCRPGTYCPRQSSEETPCPDGYSSSAGQLSCTQCVDGAPCPPPPPKPVDCAQGYCYQYQVHSDLCVPCSTTTTTIPACQTKARAGTDYVTKQTIQPVKGDSIQWKIETNDEDGTYSKVVTQCSITTLRCSSTDVFSYASTIESVDSGRSTYHVTLTIKMADRRLHGARLGWYDDSTAPLGMCSLQVLYPPSAPPIMTINSVNEQSNGNNNIGITLSNAESISVENGQRVVVRCHVEGGQPAVSDVIISCVDQSTMVAEAVATQTWKADMGMNRGKCVCSANHVTEDYHLTAEFTINIIYIPRSISLTANSQSGRLEVEEGQNVRLLCEADGHPAPMVSILGRKATESLALQVLKPTGDMTSRRQADIRAVCTDTDTYVCMASNNLGFVDDTVLLFVKCTPKLFSDNDETQREFIPNEDGELVIKIPISGYPAPQDFTLARIQQNGGRGKRDIAQSQSESKMEGSLYKVTYTGGVAPEGTVVLKMSSLFGGDGGEYVLAIQNGVGNGLHYRFTVTVLTGNETCSRMPAQGSSDSEGADVVVVIGACVAGGLIVAIITFIAGWKLGVRKNNEKKQTAKTPNSPQNVQPSLDYNSDAPSRPHPKEAFAGLDVVHLPNQKKCDPARQRLQRPLQNESRHFLTHADDTATPPREPEEADAYYVELDSIAPTVVSNRNEPTKLPECMSKNQDVGPETVQPEVGGKNNGYETPSSIDIRGTKDGKNGGMTNAGYAEGCSQSRDHNYQNSMKKSSHYTDDNAPYSQMIS